MEKKKILIRLFEFFVLGLVVGIIEDLIAINFATDTRITIDTIKIAFIVALPFAVITELIADPIFRKMLQKEIEKQKKKISYG